MTNCRLQLHQPRNEGIVLRFDKPYEGPFAGYTTIICDGNLLRMYYRGTFETSQEGGTKEHTCYAESKDGINWTKPELGLFEFNGSTANNIVLSDLPGVTHNFTPFLDTNPDTPASERFKGVGGIDTGLHALVSADGLHWKKMQDKAFLSSVEVQLRNTHLFDSQNLAFWSESEQCYVCYFRVSDGFRRIGRTTSTDFRTWTPAVLMKQIHNDGQHGPHPAPEEHLYTNQTSAYFRAPHLYVATAARFFPGRQVVSNRQAKKLNVNPGYYQDTSDSVFMTSRGGNVYDRTFLEGFLKPGIGLGNWVSRANYPALNVVQTGPTEMSLYVNHHYAQPTAHLKRYSMRLDGFASVRATAVAGEFVTRLLTFSGCSLRINFATSAAGDVRFELQDSSGKTLPGFALDDCTEIIGNEISRVVHWKSGSDLSALAGQPLRLKCSLKDADLFALQFGN